MTTLADLRQIAALASAAAPTPAVAPEATQPQPARTADGRFLPGHSGNPAGRPPRARDAGRLMLDRIAANAEALTAALIERACAGDRMALRLCVDRLLGPARSRPLHAPVEA